MQDRRIPNMQLAEEMAYAAAPYYNVARVVMSYSQLQYDELSLAADKAATAAGAEYLLYLFGIVSGDSEIAQPEALYPDLNYADSILVSKNDVMEYQGSRSEATRNMKGRLWERIRKTRVNKNLVSGKPEVSSVYDDYSITELPLSHFLIVLRFYETERAKYPKIPAYDFVGRHWGGGTVELLQDYVASSLRAIEK